MEQQRPGQTGAAVTQQQQQSVASNQLVVEERKEGDEQHKQMEEAEKATIRKSDGMDTMKEGEKSEGAIDKMKGKHEEEEERMEPRKRVVRADELKRQGAVEESTGGGEGTGESQQQQEEENPEQRQQQAHKSCVKDDNGFVYYKCRFCGLTFNFMMTLKAHERVHDVDQPYTCNKCGEAFHYMCELEYHAKSHLTQKGYKCECGRTFFQYTDLLYHRHPGDEPEPEQFVVPPPSAPPMPLPPFSSTSSMLVPSASAMPPLLHSQSAAVAASDFPTPEFMEKGFEPKHQLRVWSDVRSKPYICQYCSKSYADSRGLAYHMYSHRGERMFNPRASRYLMCRNENSYISPGLDLNDA